MNEEPDERKNAYRAEDEDRLKRAMDILDHAMRREEELSDSGCKNLLSISPDEIVEKVGQHVIGQERGTRQLAEHIAFWLRRRQALKSGAARREDLPANKALFITGSTASGKSFLVRTTCKAIGLELIEVNGASLTGAGWKGASIETLLVKIEEIQSKDKDAVTLVFVDEIDKTRCTAGKIEDTPGFNPQTDFLALLDCDGDYTFEVKKNGEDTLRTVDTDSILWVFAGAFDGIGERIVKPRLASKCSGSSCGFTASSEKSQIKEMSEEELRSHLMPSDLVSDGMLREFIGRCGCVISMPSLTVDELMTICKGSPHSLEEKSRSLMPEDVEFEMGDSAAREAARGALRNNLGARHIESVLTPAIAHAAAVAEKMRPKRIAIERAKDKDEFVVVCHMTDGRKMEA